MERWRRAVRKEQCRDEGEKRGLRERERPRKDSRNNGVKIGKMEGGKEAG